MTGSEKQIKWAEEIKIVTIETFNKIQEEIGENSTTPLFTKLADFFENCEESASWIEFKELKASNNYKANKDALLTKVMLTTKGLSDNKTLTNWLK